MKKHLLILTLLILAVFNSYAQTSQKNSPTTDTSTEDEVSKTDPIEIRKSFGTTFYQKGEKVPATLVREIVSNNPEALKEMQLFRKNYTTSVVLNTAGAFMVGYPVALALLGGNANWKMVGAGAAFIGAGIPFTKAYIRHAEKAAQIHNAGLKPNAFKEKSMEFGLNTSGLGLKLTF